MSPMQTTITQEQWAQEFIAEFKRVSGSNGHASLTDLRYSVGRYPIVVPNVGGSAQAEFFGGARLVSYGGLGSSSLTPVPLDTMTPLLTSQFAKSWGESLAKEVTSNTNYFVKKIMTKLGCTREQAEGLLRP